MKALITIMCLTIFYVIDINFPLHRYNLWRRLLRKVSVAPRVTNMRNYIPNAPVIIPNGPKHTPDLSFEKIAVVSDSYGRINNFIKNVLKDDPNSLKYLKVSCAGKVNMLLEKRVKKAHLIYGYDNLPGIEKVINTLMASDICSFYGDQLYMKI